jgi:3-deoxy-7-phosphoheptulonate synthase
MNVAGQIAGGERRIVGLMLESNLLAGAQKLVPGAPLTHGQSITDACMGWDETAGLLAELAAAVRGGREIAT